ncbi:TPA: NUDIX hydrolase [Pseudomonas aeruginosa]|nr:NUDIX hydrolase [Pseudomonas aeruginosa]
MTWSIDKATAYGGILLTRTGQILLREPANHFAGYVWTFAKGTPEPGDTPEMTALREVREETGYEVEIVDVLPGLFKGGLSTNAYFVMRHIGPQGKFDWETQATRWVDFDQAEALIGQTHNPTGRLRDLAVLAAARHWFEENTTVVLPDGERDAGQPAGAADWSIRPLPERHSVLRLDFTLGADEATVIRKGFIPQVMEEKWFSYYANDTLFQHRSWTGFCIDQVHFVPLGNGLRATHAEVNREPEQWGETDDAADIRRIESMVRELARFHLACKGHPKDPFMQAIEQSVQPNYLGSPTVVQSLLSGWLETVFHCLNKQTTYAEKMDALHGLVRIMTEDGTGYVRMPGWHTAEQLGSALVKWMGLNAEYCEGESLQFIVGEALAAISLSLGELQERYLIKGFDLDGFHEQMGRLLAFSTAVFLGTNTISFPDTDLPLLIAPPKQKPCFEELLAQLNQSLKRLPSFQFGMLGLSPGEVLQFKLNPEVSCVIAPNNQVEYQGTLMSLSRAAVLALGAYGRNVKAARGPDYWFYQGESLTMLRKRKNN